MPAQAPDRRRDRLHPRRPPRGTLFFQLLSRRYENGALLLKSNRSFSRWNEIFGDLVTATPISNRILHKLHIFNIDGPSSRLKDFN
jgi:DNA replication protein DnaC